jgi:hypothetical protein
VFTLLCDAASIRRCDGELTGSGRLLVISNDSTRSCSDEGRW